MDLDGSSASLPRSGVKEYATSRPRVLGWLRSAAILDGDWGTSVAYVMGLGFALAGYSSFWHLCFMMALTTLVAVNYITICRLYPHGGGVYSSVYHRSQLLAVIGALLLAADYVVTMALSVLDACHYLNLEFPALWAIIIISIVGSINWFGPKNSGGLALMISAFALATLATIIFSSAGTAIQQATIIRPEGGLFHNWGIFVGFILSLSGIEAISNMTGLMKDPARDSSSCHIIRSRKSYYCQSFTRTCGLLTTMESVSREQQLERASRGCRNGAPIRLVLHTRPGNDRGAPRGGVATSPELTCR